MAIGAVVTAGPAATTGIRTSITTDAGHGGNVAPLYHPPKRLIEA